MQESVYKRLARIEALAEAQKSEMMDVMTEAYARACENGNAEDAADLARKIRNKLLDNSDKEMSLDRLGLNTSSITSFITSLTNIFSSEWAEYRQALRDLPTQEGFPFDIKFPIAPGVLKEETKNE